MDYFSAVCPDCGSRFAPARLEAHRAEAHADLRVVDGRGNLVLPTDDDYDRLLGDLIRGRRDDVPPFITRRGSKRRRVGTREQRLALSARVGLELEQLTADLEAAPHEPGRQRGDLSAYGPALAEALRTCPHRHLGEAAFEGQWLCADCGRYITGADLGD